MTTMDTARETSEDRRPALAEGDYDGSTRRGAMKALLAKADTEPEPTLLDRLAALVEEVVR